MHTLNRSQDRRCIRRNAPLLNCTFQHADCLCLAVFVDKILIIGRLDDEILLPVRVHPTHGSLGERVQRGRGVNDLSLDQNNGNPLRCQCHCLLQQPLVHTPANDRCIMLRARLRHIQQFAIARPNGIYKLHKDTILNRTHFLGHLRKRLKCLAQCQQCGWDFLRLADLNCVRKCTHRTEHIPSFAANRHLCLVGVGIVAKVLLDGA